MRCVQPGVILDSLRDAAEQHHLTFAPDPSTHTHCTLGGMIGNNSCGVHSLMAGKTDDNIEELEILTYDGLRMRVGKTSDDELQRIIDGGGRKGEIYSGLRDLRDRYADEIRRCFPNIPRRVSGYNLPYLLPEHGFDVAKALVGSESTCVMVLEAKARLVQSPPVRSLLVLGYPDIYQRRRSRPRHPRAPPDRPRRRRRHARRGHEEEGAAPGGCRAAAGRQAASCCVEFGGETQRGVRRSARAT